MFLHLRDSQLCYYIMLVQTRRIHYYILLKQVMFTQTHTHTHTHTHTLLFFLSLCGSFEGSLMEEHKRISFMLSAVNELLLTRPNSCRQWLVSLT